MSKPALMAYCGLRMESMIISKILSFLFFKKFSLIEIFLYKLKKIIITSISYYIQFSYYFINFNI
jgi:hypothetical protein